MSEERKPKIHLVDVMNAGWIFEEQGNSDYLICPATIEKKLYQKICLVAFHKANL